MKGAPATVPSGAAQLPPDSMAIIDSALAHLEPLMAPRPSLLPRPLRRLVLPPVLVDPLLLLPTTRIRPHPQGPRHRLLPW
jgi:hypothetical protein